jgi:hypothetical protein
MTGRWHIGISQARRKFLMALAAAAAAGVDVEAANAWIARKARVVATAASGDRRITQLIGANGWPVTNADVAMWRNMGITWGRDAVGPGQRNSPVDPMEIDKTGPRFDSDLPSAILRNNRNGIKSLLLLGYTPKWNAMVGGDSRSAPKDVSAWERYVDAVVRMYSAPPYNVAHFQIWNEAAGRLTGGSPQATFWHGQSFRADRMLAEPYEEAMQDYVERIHIPAARIVREHGAYVVYGGWPDQGGLATFIKWLDYRSPRFNARMIDWIDYLDTHYLGVDDLTPLYQRYVGNARVRGIWQTEIGDRYMSDPHYLPMYFFRLATWALEHRWDDPDQYVSMVYHWEGVEPFRLTHRGNPRTYNVSGTSLAVLCKTVSGSLRRFPGTLAFGPGVSGWVLFSGGDAVLQVRAEPGPRTLAVSGLSGGSDERFSVAMIDAVTGKVESDDTARAKWQDGQLSITFSVPDSVNGAGQSSPLHLAYLIVTRQA